MTSTVDKAMMESYGLMVMVMGTFFVYFCGMVWAFCNPKLSAAEEECGSGERAADPGEDGGAAEPPEPNSSRACAHVPPLSSTHQATYVSFWHDTDSLLSDCNAFCREDRGINNHIGFGPSSSG